MNEVFTFSKLLSRVFSIVPQLLVALLVSILGLLLAKFSRRIASSIVSSSIASSVIDNTPIDHFLKNADLKHKLNEVVGSIIYWTVLLMTIYIVAGILELNTVVELMGSVFAYIPNFISALIVLIIGVILAGFVEKFSKSAFASSDIKTGRLIGKTSSYLVISLTAMIAFSELGIARDFILILFTGLVMAFTLGIGLAVGLGAKETVHQLLQRWTGGKIDTSNKKNN